MTREPFRHGPMPLGRPVVTLDEITARAPVRVMFDVARHVEEWPVHLSHYRYVRFRERAADGGGIVEMAAYRPFGPVGWPTWWLSEMSVNEAAPSIRFRHIGGVTKGMDVEWAFHAAGNDTHVKLLHVWDGPRWPLVGLPIALAIIAPVFVHGIASRTMAGLARTAERVASAGR